MSDVETVSAKYIFLDIVSFTHKRSIEAQSDLVAALNHIVMGSINQLKLTLDQIIFLPTGDGMCICLLAIEKPYDIHMLLALRILAELDTWNKNTTDEMRQFKVRIGINANVDNVVTDINGEKNLAGAGINIAQRVMSAADNNQILVGPVVYETLKEREKYMNNFRVYSKSAKHGLKLQVCQLVTAGHTGLNTEIPSQFVPNIVKEEQESKLSKLAAFYLAHALKLQDFISTRTSNANDAGTLAVILWILADDSNDASNKNQFEKHQPRLWGSGTASIDQIFQHYAKSDYVVNNQFGDFLKDSFAPFEDCFEDILFYDIHFVSAKGKKKLRSEHPKIWQQFGLETTLNP